MEEKSGACKMKIFEEKFWGMRSLVHEKEVHILPREKKKKRKKSGCKVFGEFPRVLAWGSGSEKVSYECREPIKSQRDLQHPLKHVC